MGRGLTTILASGGMVHTNESIKDSYYDILKKRQGSKYMDTFRRPAYYNTPLEQKDIHGYREDN